MEPTSLLPIHATTPADLLVVDALFDGLTRWNAELEPEPAVARRWTTADGGRTWTFHLAAGATFADGTPVTARHFARTWSVMASRGAAHHHLRDIQGYAAVRARRARALSGVTVAGRRTLRVRLVRRHTQFPAVVAHPALAPMLPGAEATAAAREEPVGNGAFAMAEPWAHDSFIRLTRRDPAPPDDAAGTPLHEVVFQITDPTSAYIAYEQGGMDVATVPPGGLTAETVPAERESRYRGPGLLTGELPAVYMLAFNVGAPPFDDVRARRGISFAIDREAVIDAAFEGNASPGWSIIPPVLPDGRRRACLRCTHDPARARRLLERAGVRRMTLWISEGGNHEPVARAIRHDLAAAGVRVTVRAVPFRRYQHAVRRGAPGLYRFGWSLDYPTAGNVLRPLFHSAGRANIARYDRPRVDALLDRAAAATGEQRRRLYWAAEDLILGRDQAVVPIAVLRRRVVVAERVSGLTYGPFGTANLADVRVIETAEE